MAGRPCKLTLSEKRMIIFNFVVEKGPVLLSSHNICAKLEAFCQAKGYTGANGAQIFASDFRSPDCKKIIDEYKNHDRTTKPLTSLPAYVPLDINVVSRMSPEKIKTILTNREKYISDLYARASIAIETYIEQDSTINDLKQEVDKLNTTIQSIKEELENRKDEARDLKRENQKIKKDMKLSASLNNDQLIDLYNKPFDLKRANTIKDVESDQSRGTQPDDNIRAFPISSFDDLMR